MIRNCQHCSALLVTDHCMTCGHMQVSVGVLSNRDVARIAKHTILNVMNEHAVSHGVAWVTREDEEDLDHMIKHLAAYKAGDRTEDHIGHTMTRGAMILARRTEE